MVSVPRDSSSVIIVRSGSTDEALLIRRHADLAFAGGAWVFPGGKFEPQDASQETLEKVGLAAQPSAGLIVTACRETFEESGIVLARRPNGEPCDSALADSLQRYRPEVSKDAGMFATLMSEHGLTIGPTRLFLWAHWITPSLVPKRFDTRFFVTAMPPGQSVRCDSAEATELHWLDLRAGSGLPDESFVQAPPTRFSLGDLALCLRQHGSFDRLAQAEADRIIASMTPKMVKIEGRLTVLLPWDPDYAAAPGDGTSPDAPIPPNYLKFPSRILPPRMSGMPAD
jgi:8-oxo-dGTP pyrophosphatase MutT (NUDIX family)